MAPGLSNNWEGFIGFTFWTLPYKMETKCLCPLAHLIHSLLYLSSPSIKWKKHHRCAKRQMLKKPRGSDANFASPVITSWGWRHHILALIMRDQDEKLGRPQDSNQKFHQHRTKWSQMFIILRVNLIRLVADSFLLFPPALFQAEGQMSRPAS